MIGSVLGSLNVEPIPIDVEWNHQLYTRLAEYVQRAMTALDAIECGRSLEWITIWRVPIVDNSPDLSSAAPCSIVKDFLSRQIEDVYYYVQVKTEVAGETKFSYNRCRTGQQRTTAKPNKTEEVLRLLKVVDTQTAMSEISNARAEESRSDAAKWHAECLAKDRIINDRDIRIARLEAELEVAIANQAPLVDEVIAEKLGMKAMEFLEQWALTPSDKGYAAKVLKSVLNLMASIQGDDEVKRALLKRHKGPFEGVINAFNEVAEAAKLPGRLDLPPMPRLPRSTPTRKSVKALEVRRGNA